MGMLAKIRRMHFRDHLPLREIEQLIATFVNAARIAERAGAQFVVPVAEHHDGFARGEVAIDARGTRIGRGKGHYDAALARLSGLATVTGLSPARELP